MDEHHPVAESHCVIPASSSKEAHQSLLSVRPGRPRLLRLPAHHGSTQYIPEPSPMTPCSVFSFEIPNSPAVLSAKPRYNRSISHAPTETPLSPKSVFNFEFPFEFGSQRNLRTPTSPRTPCSPFVKQQFSQLPTIEESRGSFSIVPTDEGGKDAMKPTDENENILFSEQKTDWSSIKMIMVVIFFTRIQFTVYFASLWPFLQEIDDHATSSDYALISASYSIGLAGSATVFGLWSNKLGCIRVPSITSMTLMLTSNIMYMFLHTMTGYGRYAMGVARFVAGVAAGGNALLPTYWTYAAAPADRSTAAALFDGAFCLGIAFGPGFQLLFSPLGYPGYSAFGFSFNMYTLPAMMAFMLVCITLYLMVFKFNEVPMAKKEKRGSVDSTNSFSSSTYLPPYDRLAVAICLLCKMVQMFIYATMETIGSMYTQRMFGQTRAETTQYNSTLVALSGVVGFLFLMTYVWTKIGKRVDNRKGVIMSISICLGFILLTFSWPFYGEMVGETANCSWCATVPRIPRWLYSIAYVLVFGIGFALMNVHLAAMYSSVLGPRRQSTMHGINTLLASCSRIGGPIAVADVFEVYGPRPVWLIQFGIWIFLLTAVLLCYRRLVPCVPMVKKQIGNDPLNNDK